MRKQLLALLLFILPFIAGAQCTTNNSTSCKCLDGTSTNCDLLPDIIVGRPPLLVNGTSGYIEYPQNCNGTCSGNDGRLRLSVTSPNIGRGPLEVRALNTIICGTDTFVNPAAGFTCPNGDPLKQLVVQRVYHKNGGTMTYYDRPAGSMTYHPSHGHMHVDDWGIYTLRTATSNPNPLTWPIVGTGSKLAFCLMDYGSCSNYNGHCVDSTGAILTTPNFPNYGLGGGNYGCSPSVQGISSGYTDIYYQSLDGMWVNLPAGLCNGQYWVVVQLDPKGYFLESNENNNVIAVPINLTKQSGVTPVISASGATTFCQGGTVTLTSSTATTYLWSNGATTKSIVVNQSGVYTVSVDGSSSCPAVSQPVQVTVNPVVVTPTASPATLCAGSSTTLNSNVTSNGSYIQTAAFVSSAATQAIPDNNPAGVSSVINVSGLTPTTLAFNSIASVKVNITHSYDSDLIIQLISPSGNTINLSNRRGGSGDNFTNTVFTGSATTTIGAGTAPFTGNYLPEASFSALTGNMNGAWTLKVIDQNGTDQGNLVNWTLTLNRTLATTLSYTWKVGVNTVSTLATPSFSPAATTTYSVTVNESGTGCSGTGSVAVTVGAALNVNAGADISVCAGSGTSLIATGASSYTWSPATGLNATTGASVFARPTQTTTYMVVGTNGACNDTAYTTVTVNPLPVINVNTPAGICAGGSVDLHATGGVYYAWSPSSSLNAAIGADVTASPSETTTYTVNGFDNNGCFTPAFATVNVTPYPVVSYTSASTTICPGAGTQITAHGGSSYAWSPADGLNATTGSVVTASPLVSTTYTLTGTTNGCSSSISIPVTLNSIPVITDTISGNNHHHFCSPTGDFALSIPQVANATSYTWTLPSGINLVSGAGTNSIVVNGSGFVNGDICVTANNNCGSSNSVCYSVRVYAGLPVQPAVISTPTNKGCPGDILSFSIAPINNAKTYNWTVPAGTTLLTGDGTTSITVQITQAFTAGNISVRASNPCGAGQPKYMAIKLNPVPAAPGAITGNATGVCQSTEIYTVPLKAGVIYNWTVPANASILSGQGSNSVSVQFLSGFVTGNIGVTAQTGCGTSSARTKSINPLPKQAASISGPASICTGQNGVTFTTPAVANVTYLWTVPANLGTIVSGQGTNTITVNFGTTPRSNNINVKLVNACGTGAGKSLAVTSANCTKVIDFSATGTTLNVHPNPAKDFVEVIYNTDNSNDGELNVTNILGQSQYKQAINPEMGGNSYMVDLRKLPKGIYIISIVQGENTFTQRLIVQ